MAERRPSETNPVCGWPIVIFATVGSHPTFEFDRFLRLLESVPGDDLVVQFGPGRPPANAREAMPWMTYEEILEHMNSASHVISHAGVGTILTAIRAGHVPIVFPRLRRFDETVDDHQLELARALVKTERVVLVEEAVDLASAIQTSPPRGSGSTPNDTALIEAVRCELTSPHTANTRWRSR